MPTASEIALKKIADEFDGLQLDDATLLEKNIFKILIELGLGEYEKVSYGKNLSYTAMRATSPKDEFFPTPNCNF